MSLEASGRLWNRSAESRSAQEVNSTNLTCNQDAETAERLAGLVRIYQCRQLEGGNHDREHPGTAGTAAGPQTRDRPYKTEPSTKKGMRHMPTQSFADQMNSHTMLVNSLRPRLPEMPHLEGLHQELDEVVTESRTLEDQKGFYEFQLRQTNARRRVLEQKGRELRLRLASGLRSAFGPDSQNLLEFGLKPRAVRRRRAAKPDEPALEDRAGAQ